MPQFVTLKTNEQAMEESKKATEEGLRQVAEALSKQKADPIGAMETTESEESDDGSPIIIRRRRDKGEVKVLETRVHYMKVELASSMAQLEDIKTQVEALNKRFNVFNEIELNLAYLSSLDFYLKGINKLTLEELQQKMVAFNEEKCNYVKICTDNIASLEHQELKKSLSLTLKKKEQELYLSVEEKMLLSVVLKKCIRLMQYFLALVGGATLVVLLISVGVAMAS